MSNKTIILAQGERIEIALPNGDKIFVADESAYKMDNERLRSIGVFHDTGDADLECLLDVDYEAGADHTHRDEQGNPQPCPKSKAECDAWYDAWYQAAYEREEAGAEELWLW